jgi:hypothetical protein
MDSSLISLGSGQVLPWEVHPSLNLLHQLKLFNFPVPAGIIFLNVASELNPLSSNLLNLVQMELDKREFKEQILLSCFISGEQFEKKTFHCSRENLQNTFELFLGTLRADEHSKTRRVDCLFSETVEGIVLGTAQTEKGYQDDAVEFFFNENGLALPKQSLLIDKLTLGESKILGDFRGRVQELLRSTRRALGQDNWELQWVDTGDEVFITDISPIQAPNRRTEVFTDLPFLENLESTQPNQLIGSLVGSSSSKLFQYFANWAPELSTQRLFIKFEPPRILFNLSLLSDFLRSFGFSNRLIKFFIRLESFPIHPFNAVRFWKNLPRLFRFFHDTTLSPGISRRLANKLGNFETSAEKTFLELFLEWQTIYIASSHTLYRLWAASLLPLFIFDSFGLDPDSFSKDGFKSRTLEYIFFPVLKYYKGNKSAQFALRQITDRALGKVNKAIEVKGLGLFSRGILETPEQIWNYDREKTLALD